MPITEKKRYPRALVNSADSRMLVSLAQGVSELFFFFWEGIFGRVRFEMNSMTYDTWLLYSCLGAIHRRSRMTILSF